MSITRRHLVLAGASALGAAVVGLGSEVAAQTGDEAAVAQAVEAFRKAMLAKDRAQFEVLCSDQLSYGHSAGKIETKSQFIDAAVSGLMAMMEPMMIVFLGIIVGGMVVAMYLPIFDMVNAAG